MKIRVKSTDRYLRELGVHEGDIYEGTECYDLNNNEGKRIMYIIVSPSKVPTTLYYDEVEYVDTHPCLQ